MPVDMKKIILKHALINALDFNGRANPGSVIGKVIAELPQAKKDMASLGKLVVTVVNEVNALSLGQQKTQLEKFGPIKEPKKEEKKKGLPELEGAKQGKVIMRMAPNPNGPMHIGHCRMAVLNDEYVKKYKGKLILRFDDTDPKNPNKVPMKEAYGWMEEDMKWLGVKYHKVFRHQSTSIPATSTSRISWRKGLPTCARAGRRNGATLYGWDGRRAHAGATLRKRTWSAGKGCS